MKRIVLAGGSLVVLAALAGCSSSAPDEFDLVAETIWADMSDSERADACKEYVDNAEFLELIGAHDASGPSVEGRATEALFDIMEREC